MTKTKRFLLAGFPALFFSVVCEFRSQTFDLPSLLIHTDHIYLLRKLPTNLLCQLSPGWSEARFDSIRWLKDGEDLSELVHKAENKDVAINGSSLVIFGGKQLMEGEYQCVADVSEVRLSNRQVIKTTLVSDPIKLRRARITKFDQTTNHYVHVEQGQVARLPCAGLPDVIPGPAEICFIKSNSDFEGCLSDKGNMYRMAARVAASSQEKTWSINLAHKVAICNGYPTRDGAARQARHPSRRSYVVDGPEKIPRVCVV
ncbi:hypothetical protein RB195_022735 [Necator americanus]|uniref:Ig-like domain-containing protein n=1 Tax=Necator americanus TaxID=51031 RepID=A0ABR1EGF5_NECAM